MDSPAAVTPNSVGWYILEGFPWWPVYICDQFKLRPNLHLLGALPSPVTDARACRVSYSSLVSLSKPVLRPWDCPQKESFLKGHPQHLVKKKAMMDDLQVAIQEVEDYLSQPEDIRLPQHMVPSDLDPTLEPPPPELVPQEMDVDEDAEDAEDGEDDEVDAALDEEDPDASGDSDAGKKKKAAKKASKDKKEKKEKEKKKKKTESKTKKSKSKKTVSSPKDSKSKKSKKSSSKSKDHTSDAKKRKKSSGEAVDEGGEVGSPSKVAKTALDTDVKSEPVIIEPEAADVPGKKASTDDPSGEALSVVLEKEIRWILIHCQFEEMTTKTVRKLLEDRLKMDLRHHKPEIKEGVARVIASMEEEDTVDPVAATGDSAEPLDSEKPVASIESDVAAAVTPDTALAKKNEHQDSGSEAVHVDSADENQAMEQQLADAEKDLTLALDLEPKIVDVLTSLESISAVEKNVLAASSLLPKLVQLRGHRASAISELVASLAKKWSVEDLIPAPKPIQEEDILELKAKLEAPEMSHDEVLACLNQLSETLENLNKILEQRGEKADGSGVDESVQSAQLVALERLQSMSLLTQEIIESKIGVTVSKLRKSR
ncbi:hypothetical protein BBJ28_00018657 [Nothophytophthora sp. Chile5]|nr:hypothetical protein BBJ28_00018657 [Nothophytophthora sp. Chile5]